MPTSTPLSDLIAALKASWPQEPDASLSRTDAIVALLNQVDQSTPELHDALSALPHDVWWPLWLQASHTASQDGTLLPTALANHALERRAHLWAHPDLLQATLNQPTASDDHIQTDRAIVLLLKLARVGDNPWATQDPPALVRGVTLMTNHPQAPQSACATLVGMLWQDLLRARSINDTPDLRAAMHSMWDILPYAQALPYMWANMVLVLGHTPALLDGFMDSADDVVHKMTALRSIASQVQERPVDVGLINELTQGLPEDHVAELLRNVANVEHDVQWTSDVMQVLWARSGLNEQRDTNDPRMTYVYILACLAGRGMCDELSHRLNSAEPATAFELTGVVQMLKVHFRDISPTLRVVLEHSPMEGRADFIRVFAGGSNAKNDHARQSIMGVWDLLPIPDALQLMHDISELKDIPELAAWRQKHVLEDSVGHKSVGRVVRM